MVNLALHWQFAERICVQTVRVPIPKVAEQFVERFVAVPVLRTSKGNVDEVVSSALNEQNSERNCG